MSTVLLAGCGSIGLELGQRLLAAGFQVIGLRRSEVAAPFPLLRVDFTQPIDPNILPANIDYVVHTATPAERSDAGYEQAYPNSVRHLLHALQGHPLKRYCFVSSTAVYAQDAGEWVDESSATMPIHFNGVRMLEAEQLLLQSDVPATCVRFGGIYGQGRNFLLRRVQQGCEVQSVPPSFTNRIHQTDCVGMLQFLLQQTEAGVTLDQIYLGVDNDPASDEAVCTWLAQQMNAPAPILKQATANASCNKRCANQRIRALGYTFTYPDFRSGYRAVLDTL